MKSLVVDDKFDKKKLNSFLFYNFNGLNNTTFYKALRKKDIRINHKRINANVVISSGDLIEVYISDNLLFHCDNVLIDIVYEDNNIIVVNKPIGIEVLGEFSITSLLQKKYSHDLNIRISPCHRLDRNTSGLLLFAKNNSSLEILLKKFKNHEIKKFYICLVYGSPPKNNEILTSYLFKDVKKSIVYISDLPKKGYKKIITEYKLLKKYPNNTALLEINLHTGRTHQIRAHLAHINCPIIGDGKYGINSINKAFKSKTQKLYSYKLVFDFNTSSGILDYLSNKEFNIDYSFYI